LEKHTAAARRDLEEAKAVAERACANWNRCSVRTWKKTQLKAAEAFDSSAAQTTDRHLVRLVEESRNIARETTAHMDAKSAEALAAVERAARQAFANSGGRATRTRR